MFGVVAGVVGLILACGYDSGRVAPRWRVSGPRGCDGRLDRSCQPLGAGSARSALIAARMMWAQRDRLERCRIVRRPWRARVAGIVNSR